MRFHISDRCWGVYAVATRHAGCGRRLLGGLLAQGHAPEAMLAARAGEEEGGCWAGQREEAEFRREV